MVLTSFSSGVNTSFSSQLNTNFAHNLASSTSTLSYTPGSASTKNIIIAKGQVTIVGNEIDATITLVSDRDGTLDTTRVWESSSSSTTRYMPFILLYSGTLSASTHALSVSTTSGTIQNAKITAVEFL